MEQEAALERLALDAAATRAQRGEIALTRLRYREAAAHFAAAAARRPSGQAEQHLFYLETEAAALYRQEDEFGDNGALVEAIERHGGCQGGCRGDLVSFPGRRLCRAD